MTVKCAKSLVCARHRAKSPHAGFLSSFKNIFFNLQVINYGICEINLRGCQINLVGYDNEMH